MTATAGATGTAAAVLTVSDGVVAGTRDDRSGDAVTERLTAAGFEVADRAIVPDEVPEIEAAVRRLADRARLVVTTGGTGLGPRDVTPEATRRVIDREVPGLAEAMRATGRASTPMADLSRAVVGAAGDVLVVNLPGSARGAVESLDAILAVVPHALELLAGRTRHGHADDTATGREESAHRPPHDRRLHARVRPASSASGSGGDVLDELSRRRAAGEHLVLATAIRTTGTPPCRPGERLLLGRTTDGGGVRQLAGTLGCAEFDGAALADAPGVLASGEATVATYEHDDGTVEVALEPHPAPPTLLIVSATAVARWLLTWGRDLGFRTVLVETRPERVSDDHRAAADAVVTDLDAVPLTATTAAVATDHDAPDVAAQLARLATSPVGFVGLMSSARHAAPHLAAVREAGGGDAVHRINTPVGLDLGGRSAQEIALSILAGVVAARHGRGGGWLAGPGPSVGPR